MPESVVHRLPSYRLDPNDDGEMTATDRQALAALGEDIATQPVRKATGGRETKPAEVSRRVQAVTLKVAGMGWDKIAEICHYSSALAAQRAVQSALDHIEAPKVDDLRNLENARLDRQLAAVWPQVIGGDIPAGRLALQIGERRARLNGLDKQPEATITPGAQEVAVWVQQVLAAAGKMDSTVVEMDVVDAEVVQDDDGPTDG